MKKEQLAYMAGVIDSEGCLFIGLSKSSKHPEGKVRVQRLNIKTTDAILVPLIAGWLGLKYRGNGYINILSITKKSILRKLLQDILPYLHTKFNQATNVLAVVNLKKEQYGEYPEQQKMKWDELMLSNKIMNGRGLLRIQNGGNPNFEFTWPWFAGLIDGDGWIGSAKYSTNKKIILEISLCHKSTIDAICRFFKKELKEKNNSRINSAKMWRIKLMNTELIEILPHLIPHLNLKKEQAKLAMEIINLRKVIPNGKYNHPNVKMAKEKIILLDLLNA